MASQPSSRVPLTLQNAWSITSLSIVPPSVHSFHSPDGLTVSARSSPFAMRRLHDCKMGSSQPISVLGATSNTGEGVEEGILWLVDLLRDHPRPVFALEGGPSSSPWGVVTAV